MDKDVLFSVLIANYNNGQYLDECLQSIFDQTYNNWEIVIVDDASTDNSHAIYEKYISNTRIRILKNDKNRGCGYTKRKCVENAKGGICGFVDPDDAIASEAIEVMVKVHLEKPNCSIIYSTHYICDKNLIIERIADYVGQIPEGFYSWSLPRPIISHFATFKRNKYHKTSGIDQLYLKAVDKDLYYKLEETGPVYHIDTPLYLYRQHNGGISLNNNAIEAYQYELMAKLMVILRNDKRLNIIQKMPHTKIQLINAILDIIFKLIKKGILTTSIKLLFKSMIFSPRLTFKLTLKKIIAK